MAESEIRPCSRCGADVDVRSEKCPRCGEWLAEEVSANPYADVAETLARGSVAKTRPKPRKEGGSRGKPWLLFLVILAAGLGVPLLRYRTLRPCEMLARQRGYEVGDGPGGGSALTCLRDLAREVTGAGSSEDAEASAWTTATGSTPDGSALVLLTLPSERAEDGGIRDLILECRAGGVSATIDWRRDLGTVGNVTWRAGTRTHSEPWPVGAGGRTTVFPGDARALVDEVVGATELVVIVVVTAGQGRERVRATFRPVGLRQAVAAHGEACGS